MLSERVTFEADPKMWNLWSAAGVTLFYLYFVLWAGPKAMASRKPFSLKSLLIIYNGFMVTYCYLWMYKLFSTPGLLKYIYNTFCNCQVGAENKHLQTVLTDLSRYYFYAKIIDLLDTVFFVLRKKDNQISFLHVYHHASMIMMTWHNLIFERANVNIFVIAANTGVHVVMYFYYFLSSLGPATRKFLFWKKYVTIIQLCSFIVMLAYMVTGYLQDCNVQKRTFYLSAAFNISILALFLNFFIKSYHNKKVVKKE